MKNQIKRFTAGTKAKIGALSLAIASGVFAASSAFAAVDPDVAATSKSLVGTMKENVTGVITANISDIVIVGVIIFSLSFVWKLSKKFMK